MKSPTCAVYKFTRAQGFNDNSPYDVYCAPPGLHTATYNRKTGEWVVYQPLTVEDASPDALIMAAWVGNDGLVTTVTAPDLDTLYNEAPLWVFHHVVTTPFRRNTARWFGDGGSIVASNLNKEDAII